jgi:hypothetical protein
VGLRDALRRLTERVLLPWYDRDEARAAAEHNEQIRQRSIAARIAAERIRRDYTLAAERLRR